MEQRKILNSFNEENDSKFQMQIMMQEMKLSII